jgi:putative transcriptional regulator (Ypuh-like)
MAVKQTRRERRIPGTQKANRALAYFISPFVKRALLSCNRQLALVGLQMRIVNGVVSLLTTEVHCKALAAYLNQQNGGSGNSDLTTAILEVLACIAFKQPISQAEIDHFFAVDRRGLVVKPRVSSLSKNFPGPTAACALRQPKRSCNVSPSRVCRN